MFEDTQTSVEMDTNEEVVDLFADDEATSPYDEQTSESEETVAEETAPEEPTTPEAFLDIVYNGQQIGLTKEEAITLAQKGQNYDKKLQEIEMLKNSPERMLMQQLAQQSNMPYDQFLNSFAEQIKQSTLQVRAEQLMQTGVMDQNTAMRLAQAELEKEELMNQRNAEQMRVNAEQQKKEQFAREFGALLKENPDFQKKYPTVESMPKVMQDAFINGTSMKDAYHQVQIEELRSELATYKRNENNKSMSPGSATGVGSQTADPFLEALFGD